MGQILTILADLFCVFGLCPAPVQTIAPTAAPSAAPSAPPTYNNDIFRLKMYHEQGYFWQCDNVCNTSDPNIDKDPKWCLQCDGTTCEENEFAKVQTCDIPTSSANTLFELVPTATADEVMIRAIATNMCLTTANYTDTAIKMNTRMKSCGSTEGQIWWSGGFGEFSGDKFEIHPQSETIWCLTTQHHPLDGEDARVERCGLARKDVSNWWVKYYPSYNW